MQTTATPAEPAAENLRRAAIDRSVKGPVLFLFTNAAFWLMASALLGFLSAVKQLQPDFIANWEFLTFGRLRPAHLSALIYGWGIQAALGASLWLMARRTANELRSGQGALITLGVLWNVAVTIGIVGILAGYQTSIEWLEMPKGVWVGLAIILTLFAWRIVGMAARPQRTEGFTITTWYLLGAALWVVWIFWTVIGLLGGDLSLGALGTGISSWYVHTMILMFFVPVGVGSAYYFIPKVTGQPIASAQLANIGFWMLAVLGGWAGFQRYLGGPLPGWMTSVGSLVGVLLLIPVGVVGVNHHLTTLGNHSQVKSSPTLLFTYFGSLFYPVSGLVLALISLTATGVTFQFTPAWYGYQIAAVYGFFSMAIFGAIYYIVPRLAGCEWLSTRFIRNHFWFSVYGIGTIVIASVVAGIAQGGSLNNAANWSQSFAKVFGNSYPYIVAQAFSWLFILFSNTLFLLHLVLMVLGLGRRSSQPTLLAHDEEDHASPHGEPA
jgi:cytochrome c oxidase cbb3-type subunit I